LDERLAGGVHRRQATGIIPPVALLEVAARVVSLAASPETIVVADYRQDR
jgi:hypothetical protein